MTTGSGGTQRATQGQGAVRGQQTSAVVDDGDIQGLAPLEVPAALTVHDLAAIMDVGPVEIIKALIRNGYMFTINDVVEHDVVALIAPAFGYALQPVAQQATGSASLVISPDNEEPSLLESRPPVVTILGHVDHGKTTLLDAIRESNIVGGEAGGITQHIGAYQVDYNGRPICFLDTPGHEAFTAMRARGAQVTDIAILVVAADDGIMPQTLEAISHAKAAEVPIVVAINKVDRPDADLERVKRQLAENELLIEEWGGDVIAVPVSALTGEGISDLLENVLVVAEIGEFKANPHRPAQGVVVEARRDKSRGTVATILVQTGTLEIGDNLVAGQVRGRVKAMFTDKGSKVTQVGPSRPVELLGINGLPEAGDIMEVATSEKAAREMVEFRQREKQLQRAGGPTLEDVYARIQSGEVKALKLIVKTDVQGTVEAIRGSLEGLNTDQGKVIVVHAASGSITESDVLLAAASNAIIVGFNSRPEPGARALANLEGVEVRHYAVIYTMLDDIEKALVGLLEPVLQDITIGRATIRAVFTIGRRTTVAGIYVNDGRITRNSTAHLLRNGQSMFVGPISSLKHFKDDVREVAAGLEGGVTLENFRDYQEGDILEAHVTEQAS